MVEETKPISDESSTIQEDTKVEKTKIKVKRVTKKGSKESVATKSVNDEHLKEETKIESQITKSVSVIYRLKN